jgi:predicted MFS family arabinose efflux permease
VAGLPLALARWGYPGGFSICVFMCMLALPFCLLLPRHAEGLPRTVEQQPQLLGADAPPSALAVLLVVGSIGIYSIGEQALWAFAGEIGIRNVGIPMESIGTMLSVMTIAGCTGGFLAWKIGARFGRTLPVLFGCLGSAISRFGFMVADDYATMMASAILWAFSFYYVSPYQMGVAAAMDRTGRIAVAAGALMNFGYAFGPGIGGAVIGYLGQQALMLVVVGCALLSLAMMLPVAMVQDRSARLLLEETAPE